MFASLPIAKVLGVAPVCVYPSMIKGSVMTGNWLDNKISKGPAPGMLKWISSGEPPLTVLLAAAIASRREQLPGSHVPFESLSFVTVKIGPI